MERGELEGYLSEGLSLERIGRMVGKHPTTVAYWLRKHGLTAVGSARYAPRGGLAREQLVPLVESGLTLGEMAVRLDRSISAVARALERHGLRTTRATARRAVAGLPAETIRACRRHGVGRFVREAGGAYRCTRCRAENVAEWRRRTKRRLVDEAGGACALCGYDRCLGALHFHHLDPSTKAFALSRKGVTRSLDRLRVEIAKCVLLCSNCHAEVESGIVELEPVTGVHQMAGAE
jgi:hypothetical protein